MPMNSTFVCLLVLVLCEWVSSGSQSGADDPDDGDADNLIETSNPCGIPRDIRRVLAQKFIGVTMSEDSLRFPDVKSIRSFA